LPAGAAFTLIEVKAEAMPEQGIVNEQWTVNRQLVIFAERRNQPIFVFDKRRKAAKPTSSATGPPLGASKSIWR